MPSRSVKRRHRNTAYCPDLDHLNYLVSCEECFIQDCEYYQERWDEYYGSR